MKAIRLHGVRDLRLDEIPIPQVGDDEVLIQVRASSLDGTDLEILHGVHRLKEGQHLPVQGHEYAGVVVARGATVATLREGDRVTGPWGIHCGLCAACRQGVPNLCQFQQHFGVHADGAWAEFMRVPARLLVPLPERISFEDGALLCCALPTALRGLERAQIQLGDSVVVLGLGQMGLSVVIGAHLKGAAPIIGIDPVARRAALAQRFGATHTLDSSGNHALTTIKELTAGQGADHCIVTVSSIGQPMGLPSVADTALGATRPGGRITFIGLPGRAAADLNLLQGKELTIVGSKAMLGPDYLNKILRFVAAGGLDLDLYRTMVTHNVRLSELCNLLLGDELHDAIKIIITPG